MTDTIDTRYFDTLKTVKSVRRTDLGAELTFDNGLLRIDILADDVIRIKATQSANFDEQPSASVVGELSSTKRSYTINEDSESIQLSTDSLTVIVSFCPLSIDAYRADGSVIFETDAIGQSQGFYHFLNDEFIVARKLADDDIILGLGEKTGPLNRNGLDYTLWNTDVLNPNASGEFTQGLDKTDPRSDPTSTSFDPYYVSIQFYLHVSDTTGDTAGFFVDNPYRGHFEFSHENQFRFHFCAGQYTEYIFAGPDPKTILAQYADLTGHMEPPPIWSLGHHQCRWHPYDQADIEALAQHYRVAKIPCDVLWIDIDYMDGYRVFTWDEKRYPDRVGMLKRLEEHGLRCVTIIDPGVKAEPGNPVYDSGVALDVFCKTAEGNLYTGQVWPGKTVFPDFATETARQWWGKFNAAHVESGIAGIWNDMNEPATGDIPPDSMRFDHGSAPHERYHNEYALLMAQGTYDGLRSATPECRTFILSRAGSPGIQRCAANWLGDNMSRWDHLRLSIAMSLGMGLSGQPFIGADIGGFAENCTEELLARWVQYGALTPFCRNHNAAGSIDQYPWSFGEEVQEIYRQSVALRYRLMPMLVTAFMQASETALPVMRPLFLNDPSDSTARTIDDQYLLGDHLLVAPVCISGAVSRELYLPVGSWYPLKSDEPLVGGCTITADAPLDTIPVYARGGAVVPMWPDSPPSTMDYQPETIELHIFVPLENGVFKSTLHEDDGLTFANENGAFLRTGFTVTRTDERLTLDAECSGNGFPEHARKSFDLVFHGRIGAEVTVNGTLFELSSGRVRIENSGDSLRVVADLK